MSTPNFPSPDAPHGVAAPAGPPVPPGWLANWSAEHNSWFYVFTATGATQWEYPTDAPSHHQTPPPPPAPLDGQHQPQYSSAPGPETPYAPGPDGASAPGPDGDRGLGKTALAIGGGFLTAASLGPLGHKFGAKMAAFFGDKHHSTPPPAPTPQTQVHVYPVYVPGPQGHQQAPPPYHSPPPPMAPNHGHYSPGPGMAPSMTPSMSPGMAPGMAPGMPPPMSPPMPVNTGAPGGFASHGPPPLYIYGAVFADSDVTQTVRSLITPQQSISLKGDSLVKHLGDPWPEAGRKSFNVLYAYGDRPMEMLAVDTETTHIEIKHEAISKKRMEFCQPPPSRIIACVWGLEDASTVQRRQQLEKDGEMEGSDGALGHGGFWGWEPRTLVCYYRGETGDIRIACCREGGTLRLPWNPLAKWS